MFGLDGSALVTGTIASDATYTESVDIESRIETLGDLADIDGNGDIDALTDGCSLCVTYSVYRAIR